MAPRHGGQVRGGRVQAETVDVTRVQGSEHRVHQPVPDLGPEPSGQVPTDAHVRHHRGPRQEGFDRGAGQPEGGEDPSPQDRAEPGRPGGPDPCR